MVLANQEAQLFNHKHIDTEHILIALIKEGSGVACAVLKNLGIDLTTQKIRSEVEKIVKPGPDIVHIGTLSHTPESKAVIKYATEAAKSLNHNYIGTEHILLGLLIKEDPETVANKILDDLGIKIKDVREGILELLESKKTKLEKTVKCKFFLADEEEEINYFLKTKEFIGASQSSYVEKNGTKVTERTIYYSERDS